MQEKKLKICEKGHRFYKSSDCFACPVCAQEQKPESGFLSKLSAPARRALIGIGISDLHQLTSYSAIELLTLHGMGPSAISSLEKSLDAVKLKLKENTY